MVNRPVKIVINDNTVETTFAELGFANDGNTHIDEAFKAGKSDSFMERIFAPVYYHQRYLPLTICLS